jgi:hypothetical protein
VDDGIFRHPGACAPASRLAFVTVLIDKEKLKNN